MSSIPELIVEMPLEPEPQHTPSTRSSAHQTSIRDMSPRNEQIHLLVQQLFFQPQSQPVRHVGVAPVDSSTSTATLCLEVAQALAEDGRYDVGLIDAHSDLVLLQTQLQLAVPVRDLTPWPIGPRLWMIPRQSWLQDAREPQLNEQNLSRLHDLTTEFDFSILWCAPVSWLTLGIVQACDGLVLVLSANKTRRLVASQIRDQLHKAKVPLLGAVLADRRFPVPQGLYRNL